MDNWTVGQLAFVLAENARVLGMQAENEQRKHLGASMVYTEESFSAAAATLDSLAIRIINGS